MSLSYIWRDRPAKPKSPSTVLTAHNSTGNRTFMCNTVKRESSKICQDRYIFLELFFLFNGKSLNRLISLFPQDLDRNFTIISRYSTVPQILNNVLDLDLFSSLMWKSMNPDGMNFQGNILAYLSRSRRVISELRPIV